MSNNRYANALALAKEGNNSEGDNFVILPITTSTMHVVDAAIESGTCTDGYTVIALKQTAGVGSIDPQTGKPRNWWSAEGNLLISRAIEIQGGDCALEIEFVAALAVAEIIADLLPRPKIMLKYPNDVLIDGAKVCGCLVPPKYDDPVISGLKRLINLGVGVNLAATPPASAARENAVVKAGTSLKDHGVIISIDHFLEMFDSQFSVIRDLHRQAGFIGILQRIGFADQQSGLLTLQHRDTAMKICGAYEKFSTEKLGDDTYANFLHLRIDGKSEKFPFKAWNAIAVIAPRAVGTARRSILPQEPHA